MPVYIRVPSVELHVRLQIPSLTGADDAAYDGVR